MSSPTRTVELTRRELAVLSFALYRYISAGYNLASDYADEHNKAAFTQVMKDVTDAQQLRATFLKLKEGLDD